MSSRNSHSVTKPHPSKAENKGKTKIPSKPSSPPITKNGSGLSMTHEYLKAFLPMSPSPSASTSKSQTCKFPEGLERIPARTFLRSPSTTYTKRYINTLNVPRKSSAVRSDDLSKSRASKKKNSSRSSTPVADKNSLKPLKKRTRNTSVDSKTSKETVVLNRKAMHQEGPMDFTDFDFYSFVEKSKSWEIEEEDDEEEAATVTLTKAQKIEVCRDDRSPSPIPKLDRRKSGGGISSKKSDHKIKTRESEIWGELQTSTAEEESSSPPSPSVLSISDEKTESGQTRDENNNLLSSIKNTMHRSVTFFEPEYSSGNPSTTNEDNKGAKENERKIPAVVDSSQKNENGSVHTSKDIDKVNNAAEQNHINPETRDINNNIVENSPPKESTTQNPTLIPNESPEKSGVSNYDESLRDYCTRQLQNHLAYQAKLKRSEAHMIAARESQSMDEPPSLTMLPESPQEMKKLDSTISMRVILEGGGLATRELSVGAMSSKSSHKMDLNTEESGEKSPITSIPTTNTTTSTERVLHPVISSQTEPIQDIFDSQETQTFSITFQDAETDTENLSVEQKLEKLKSLVISVNAGVEIAPENKRKSVKLRGIMKTSRQEGIKIESTTSNSSKHVSHSPEGAPRRRSATPEKIRYPQTFTQVGADYGFPADISISGIIKNLVGMTWASTGKGDVKTESIQEKNEANNSSNLEDDQESNHLVESAYDIFNAGLKLASDLIGSEGELEPREDWVRYNGYKIRVCGKRLLLESLHVNCDFNIDSNGFRCRNSRSSSSLCPPSISRTELEQSCEGRRIRIVIRVAGPMADQDAGETGASASVHHNVKHSEGKWTLIYGNEENRNDCIEIECPTGVHPDSLAYDLLNGFLLVDAP